MKIIFRKRRGLSYKEVQPSVYHLGSKLTWCSAYDAFSERFSVGFSDHACVLDGATRRLWEYQTGGSAVYCQTFDSEVMDFIKLSTNICNYIRLFYKNVLDMLLWT